MNYDIRKLSEALKILKRVAAQKNLNEEMGCVLIKEGKAWATNGIITMSIGLDTNSDEMLLLPPKAIDIITLLREDKADISVKKSSVIIKSKKGTHKFAMGDVNAFVLPNRINMETTIELNAEKVKNAFKSVAYAVNEKSSRKEMTGIHLNGNGKTIDVVGCDGCRLALSKIESDKKFSVILPMDTVRLVMGIKTESEDDVLNISVGSGNALIAFENIKIYTLLYSGKYLDYNKTMSSSQNGHLLNADSVEMTEILQRAIACWDTALKVPLEMEFNNRKLYFKMNTSTIDFEETIDANCDTEIRLGVNPRFLLEAFNNLSADIKLEWINPISPIFISDETTTAVVLPVRLKE